MIGPKWGEILGAISLVGGALGHRSRQSCVMSRETRLILELVQWPEPAGVRKPARWA